MEKIVSGRTIDEAVENACSELNISRDEFSYEILDMEKKGFLGIGTKPAKIKVVYQVSPAAFISDFLKGLFEKLGVNNYSEKIDVGEENVINIQLDGEELTSYTLRYTDIVESVQFLLVMSLNKQLKEHYKVTFNINDYKEKSISRLEALAVKTANQVSKTRRKVTLFPMSAYQRRIIHARLQTFKSVTTYSVGEEPNRRVVVAYQGEGGRDGKPYAGSRNGGGRRPGPRPNGDSPRPYNDRGNSDRRNGDGNSDRGGYSRNGNSSDKGQFQNGARKPYNRDNRRPNGGNKPAPTTTGEPFKLKQIYPKPADSGKADTAATENSREEK